VYAIRQEPVDTLVDCSLYYSFRHTLLPRLLHRRPGVSENASLPLGTTLPRQCSGLPPTRLLRRVHKCSCEPIDVCIQT
jgi:hypothetical protein